MQKVAMLCNVMAMQKVPCKCSFTAVFGVLPQKCARHVKPAVSVEGSCLHEFRRREGVGSQAR